MKSGLLEGYLATLYITPLAEVPGFVHGLKRTLWKQISSFEKKKCYPKGTHYPPMGSQKNYANLV